MTQEAGRAKSKGETPQTGRILCIDDFPEYAEMIARLLERDGHTVQTELVPVSLQAIADFKPDLILLSLVRKLETISAGGMRDFYTDVDGAKAFRQISRAVKEGQLSAPVIVAAVAVLERELPKDEALDYLAFIEVPQKLAVLPLVIRKVLEGRSTNGGWAPE